MPFADYVVHIDADGHIDEQGTFADLSNGGGYISSLSLPQADWSHAPEQSASSEGGNCSDGESHTTTTKNEPDLAARVQSKELVSDATSSRSPGSDMETPDNIGDDSDHQSRRTGDVKIYMYYARSVGWLATLLFVVAITGFVFSVSFPSEYIVLFFFALFSLLGKQITDGP